MTSITDAKINSIVNTAKVMGKYIRTLSLGIREDAIAHEVAMDNNITLVLIPSTVKTVSDLYYDDDICEWRSLSYKIFNTVKVMGGSGLRSTKLMFNMFRAKTIDVTELDTSNVTDMSEMFRLAQVNNLRLCGLNTSKVTNMISMFEGISGYPDNLKLEELDLSLFDTSVLHKCNRMFCGAEIGELVLTSFNDSSISAFDGLFSNSNIGRVLLQKKKAEVNIKISRELVKADLKDRIVRII